MPKRIVIRTIKLGVLFPITVIGFVHGIVPALMFSSGMAGIVTCNEAIDEDLAKEKAAKKQEPTVRSDEDPSPDSGRS